MLQSIFSSSKFSLNWSCNIFLLQMIVFSITYSQHSCVILNIFRCRAQYLFAANLFASYLFASHYLHTILASQFIFSLLNIRWPITFSCWTLFYLKRNPHLLIHLSTYFPFHNISMSIYLLHTLKINPHFFSELGGCLFRARI